MADDAVTLRSQPNQLLGRQSSPVLAQDDLMAGLE
jgi:hypothetical protein